jgi:hypothetical protein
VHIDDRNGVWVSSLHPGIDLRAANFAHDLRRALRELELASVPARD